MKRPSYREAVQWIANNDEDAVLEKEVIEESVTVLLIADIFRIEPARVAKDVLRNRLRIASS